MSLPPMTPGQRAAALAKAAQLRTARSQLRASLKRGEITLAGALNEDAAAGMKVSALLQGLPGVGKVRAERVMQQHKIPANRRVRGLGPGQRAALEAEFAPAPA